MNINPLLLLFLSVSDNNSGDLLKSQSLGNAITFDPRSSLSVGNIATTDTSSNLYMFLLHDQLFYNVLSGDYDNAVMLSLALEQNDKGKTVADVVSRLLSNGTQNIVEYAYKLWNYGGKGIVISYFPAQFKHIFNGDIVKFTNERDGLPVKLDANTDQDGDRRAWGDGSDKSVHRLTWKVINIWESNKVYFKFLNVHRDQYLKLEIKQDNVGDRKAFGSNEADTDRHQWYLRPVKYNNDMLFYIYNRKYNQPLIFGRWLDSYEDRILWGSHDEAIDNPEHFAWHIDAIES